MSQTIQEEIESTELKSSDIILAHPELFGTPPFDLQRSLIGFGFECSKHWYPILKKGFDDIAEIVKDQNITNFRITQVKEKFGNLSVYCNNYTDDIDEVIDRMEEEASTICELCGSPEGKLRTDGWLVVRCDKCQEDWFAKQYK